VSDLRVELLANEDCPHLERARLDLQSVLRTSIIEVPIQLVFVSSQDEAEFLEFPGSPTIRVNGEDVVPQPELPFAVGCRIYRDENGEMTGSPPISAIKRAVDAHRRGRLEEFRREEAANVARFAREADAAEAGGSETGDAED
jgi:hypothetical protein